MYVRERDLNVSLATHCINCHVLVYTTDFIYYASVMSLHRNAIQHSCPLGIVIPWIMAKGAHGHWLYVLMTIEL